MGTMLGAPKVKERQFWINTNCPMVNIKFMGEKNAENKKSSVSMSYTANVPNFFT